ncbi:MAG: GTPase Era [Actinobacteria bacterium]|nr:GTPase Era [Actinomycetota bacterium]
MPHKSAFISIVGRPNTGKSTLLNTLVGKKISITSHHPNTTRLAIKGILTEKDYQLIFIDTPGLHKAKTSLGTTLNQVVHSSIKDVDIVIQCLPAIESIGSGDLYIARQISAQSSMKRICVITMVEMVNKQDLAKQLISAQDLANKAGFSWDEIVPVSAFTDEQIQLLIDLLVKHAENGPVFYPSDMLSDQDKLISVAELIRESAISNLREEVPHSVAVKVDDLQERPDGKLVDIHASIIVERDSQKAILIGKRGSNLKEIGTNARNEIEKILCRKVYLALHVKVIENWQKDSKALQKLGFIQN